MIVYCTTCSTDKEHSFFSPSLLRLGKTGYLRGTCFSCTDTKRKVWRLNNADKEHAMNARWHAKNKDKKNAKSIQWRLENPGYQAIKHRFNTYGLTDSMYINMLRAQNHSCKACGDVFTKTPHVDHDHSVTEYVLVRYLLCNACNTTLGMQKEDTDRILKLAAYNELIKSER